MLYCEIRRGPQASERLDYLAIEFVLPTLRFHGYFPRVLRTSQKIAGAAPLDQATETTSKQIRDSCVPRASHRNSLGEIRSSCVLRASHKNNLTKNYGSCVLRARQGNSLNKKIAVAAPFERGAETIS